MRCELLVATCVAFGLAGAACHSPEPAPRTPSPALPPALIPPGPIDPKTPGAGLLTELAAQLQPAWGQFLEDCRTRLPGDHVLNRGTLAATAELAIDRVGRIQLVALAGSGQPDFDRAVADIVGDAAPIDPPEPTLLADDDRVHVRWLFARDRRQAGPATAELFSVELPLAQVTEQLLARGELARAAARIARAPEADPARGPATERVMIEVLRDVVATARGAEARRAAVEAIGRAKVSVLAADVRALMTPTTATELRIAAIETAAALGDRAAVNDLASALPGDLAGDPTLALAETAALVALGQQAVAEQAVRRALEQPAPPPAALSALAAVAIPTLDGKLASWFGRGDARVRAAICTSITRPATRSVAVRGLRDADATVRAACVDAIARLGPARAGGDAIARIRDLARDRDRTVRARAVFALDAVQGGQVPAAIDDAATEVRAAAVLGARDPQLAALAADPDPDVRAAAITELATRQLGDKQLAIVARAAADEASQVRRAAVPSIVDEPTLARLATDDAPEVASDAQVALVQRRGRAAAMVASLERIAAGASDRERVRLALAWLLATRP